MRRIQIVFIVARDKMNIKIIALVINNSNKISRVYPGFARLMVVSPLRWSYAHRNHRASRN